MPYADPAKQKEYFAEHFQANRARKYATAKKSYQRNRAKHIARCRKYFIARSYGLTEEQYSAMLEKQGGVCGVCKKTQRSGRRLAIDHDHNTGRVRGLLCQSCNARVEKFVDYIGALENGPRP